MPGTRDTLAGIENIIDELTREDGANPRPDELSRQRRCQDYVKGKSLGEWIKHQLVAPGMVSRILPYTIGWAGLHAAMPLESNLPQIVGLTALMNLPRTYHEEALDAMRFYENPTTERAVYEARQGALRGALLGVAGMVMVSAGKALGWDSLEQVPWVELALYAPAGAIAGALMQPFRAYVEGRYHSKRASEMMPVKDESA